MCSRIKVAICVNILLVRYTSIYKCVWTHALSVCVCVWRVTEHTQPTNKVVNNGCMCAVLRLCSRLQRKYLSQSLYCVRAAEWHILLPLLLSVLLLFHVVCVAVVVLVWCLSCNMQRRCFYHFYKDYFSSGFCRHSRAPLTRTLPVQDIALLLVPSLPPPAIHLCCWSSVSLVHPVICIVLFPSFSLCLFCESLSRLLVSLSSSFGCLGWQCRLGCFHCDDEVAFVYACSMYLQSWVVLISQME